MERKNGYLIIDEWKKIKRPFIGHNAKAWFTNGKEEYLFKTYLDEVERYKELYYALVIKKLGLNSPKIDLAKLGNRWGTISKNYNPDHNESYTLEEIIVEPSKYNLKELPYVITEFCIEKNGIIL